MSVFHEVFEDAWYRAEVRHVLNRECFTLVCQPGVSEEFVVVLM